MLLCISVYGLPRGEMSNSRYSNPDNDPRGVWTSGDLSVGPVVNEKVYPITLPSGRIVYPTSGRYWLYPKEKLDKLIEDNRIWFGEDGNNVPRIIAMQIINRTNKKQTSPHNQKQKFF